MADRQLAARTPSGSSLTKHTTKVRLPLSRLPVACIGAALLLGSGVAVAVADEDSDRRTQFFETNVRPVLIRHCYSCHSASAGATEGDFSLDSRAGLRQGGSRGPAVVPGDPAASRLLLAASHSDPDLQMPPDRPRLPERVLADLRLWIEQGAVDPRDQPAEQPSESSLLRQVGGEFWSYQPLKAATRPEVSDTDWPVQEMDYFVLSRLEEQGLTPAADAAPHELLRRLYFTLIGLPPAPEELSEFLRDVQSVGPDDALAAVADRLLTSPACGERWGRHWMDVARFGESSGKEANISFPYAWRYRDYVIDSFQRDMPFDRFLTEQIAGDLLPWDSAAERARLLTATGFLAVGTKNLDAVDALQFQADIIDEQIDSLTRAVLGSSIACARCHDHKFDPFTMRDYYALAGIFVSTRTYFGTAVSPANRQSGDPLPLPEVDGQQIFHRSIGAKRVQELRAELDALQQARRDGMAAVRAAIAEGRHPGEIFPLREALRIFWRSGRIEGELEKVDEQGRALPLAMGVLEADAMADAPLLARGDIAHPQQLIPRGFPDVIPVSAVPSIPEQQSGRLQLAEWLTDPQNPLTGRVIVNRVWSHVFGSGLVRSVDNFGAMGDPPSHPELLDYLTDRFIQDGWSIRRLVRQLVLARTFRQSAAFDEAAFQHDPENKWLWRMNRRRLDAECIRDAMLVVSGHLDPKPPAGSLVARVIGDRPISLIGLDSRLPPDLDGATHRSVYLPVIRDRLPEVLELFDFAEPSLVTGSRETTNVPVQALYLMNSPFVRARAEGLADRLLKEADSLHDRIDRAFIICFCRPPETEERQRSESYLASSEFSSADQADIDRELWVSFCHALLATAEFRNLD